LERNLSEKIDQPETFVTACGGQIQSDSGYPSAYFQGKRVFFCTQACLRVFEAAPNAFMAGEIDHPTE
jgi:YHS domain-containing protein